VSLGAGASSEAHLGGIARGGALNLVGAVVAAAGQFGLVVIVANGFDERTAGTLFAAVSVFLILQSCAALGSDAGLGRFMLRLELRGRAADVGPTLRVAFQPVLVASLVLAVALVVLAGPLAPAIGLGDTDGAAMLRVVAVALPFAVVGDFCLALTRAFGRMRPTVLTDSILRTTLQAVAVLVASWAGAGAVATAAAWAAPYLLTGTVATAVALRLVVARTRRRGTAEVRVAGPVAPAATPLRALRREFWAYTAPRGVAQVFQIGLQRADIVLVAAILGPAEAAVYTAATRFVVVGQFATQAIQRVLQPRFTHLLAEDRPDDVATVFRTSTAWSVLLSWPVYLTVACAAPVYLRVFGAGYEAEGTGVVVAMALAMMLAAAAGPLDTLLLMSGRSLNSLLNTGAALAVDVTLCVVLLPRWGLVGAAVAWASAVVLRNALALTQVHHDLRVTPFGRGTAVAALATTTCIAGPLLVVRWTVGLDAATVLVTLGVGGSLLAAVLWAARDPLALTALRSVVRRRGTQATAGS
jgi:O-antigen/teichoic acid export membrane protein